eukprot:SAG31_NODE_586_length_13839_cov_22.698544_8_plen_81_part_00
MVANLCKEFGQASALRYASVVVVRQITIQLKSCWTSELDDFDESLDVLGNAVYVSLRSVPECQVNRAKNKAGTSIILEMI